SCHPRQWVTSGAERRQAGRSAISEQIIKLADDSANTGKKVRVFEQVVGPNTVQHTAVTPCKSDGTPLDGVGTSLPVCQAQPAASTGSLTGVGQAVTVATAGYAVASFSVQGTYSETLVFEGSDDSGATWYAIQAVRADSATIET